MVVVSPLWRGPVNQVVPTKKTITRVKRSRPFSDKAKNGDNGEFGEEPSFLYLDLFYQLDFLPTKCIVAKLLVLFRHNANSPIAQESRLA